MLIVNLFGCPLPCARIFSEHFVHENLCTKLSEVRVCVCVCKILGEPPTPANKLSKPDAFVASPDTSLFLYIRVFFFVLSQECFDRRENAVTS